jgi:hypothetical protein
LFYFQKIFLEQAKLIETTKDEPLPDETRAEDSEVKRESQKDDNSGGSTKRVTLVEPDNPNALYTIEEKGNGAGENPGDDDDNDDHDGQD